MRMLKMDGWFIVRQEGSHVIMRHPTKRGQVSVREEEGFSAVGDIADKFIGTQGNNIEELKRNILEVVNLSFFEDGFRYNIDEIELKLPAEKPETSLH